MSRVSKRTGWVASAAASLAFAGAASGQTVLERLLTHAGDTPVAMERSVAERLASKEPAEEGAGRALLDAWLAQAGAACTRTLGEAIVVYESRAEAAHLLVWQGRVIEPEELVLHHTDLVWVVDPPDHSSGAARIAGVVEFRWNDRTIFGGRADHILMRLGASPHTPEVEALQPVTADWKEPSTLAERLPALGGIVTGADEDLDRLASWLCWGNTDGLLAAVGARVNSLGEEGLRVTEVSFPAKRHATDRWYPVVAEDPRAAWATLRSAGFGGVHLIEGKGLYLTGPSELVQRQRRLLQKVTPLPPKEERRR